MILERATGRTVSDYLSEKIWRPFGMEAPGSWSLDSRHDGFEKMESGLNARAVDFAKLGLLYLHGGLVGRPASPAARLDRGFDSSRLRRSPVPQPGLGREEWARPLGLRIPAGGSTRKLSGRFFAYRRNLGQFIYVAPDNNAVLLRFGTGYGDVAWMTPSARSWRRSVP